MAALVTARSAGESIRHLFFVAVIVCAVAIGTVLGLILLGIAFFVGPLLWLAAEKWCPKQNGK